MKNVPKNPSQCVAALSLKEEDADRPYISIFYTADEGNIHFFGILVVGTEEVEEEQRLLFKRPEQAAGSTNEPNDADVLVSGTLFNDGAMALIPHRHGEFHIEDKDAALTFASVMRAVYQMQGDLTQTQEQS